MGNANDDTVAMPAVVDPLILKIVQQNLANFQASANQQIESLQARLADREAELAAIRTDVQRLIWGDYMPTPAALDRALQPSKERIAQFRGEAA